MATKKRRRRHPMRLLLILLFVLATLAGIYRCVVRPLELPAAKPEETPEQSDPAEPAPPPAAERKPNFFNILVSGVDDGNGGSDTNILVSFDAGGKAVHCVSIPRDTLVNTDWKIKKINAAYNIGGTERLASEVSRLLGVPVDFTVQVNLQGFIDLVNAIGGVDFEIPISMNYDDPLQNLHIHFKKGMKHLDGKQAMGVVRFRHNNDGSGYGTEDIGRIGTQQAFLKAVIKKMLSLENLDQIPTYAKLFGEYVKTELSVGQMAWLGQEAMKIGVEGIQFHTLPGDGSGFYKGIGYYTLNKAETLTLVNSYLNPYTAPRSAGDLDILEP
ncbi:MAG: LCP family protein [Ruthenibacterium sp.]